MSHKAVLTENPVLEPLCYADDKLGIRIEGLVLVRKSETSNNFGAHGYLGFEKVSMSPIHTKLINISLLTDAERIGQNN